MKTGMLHSLLLLFILAAVAPATENPRQAPILIGKIELSFGMPRDAALAALKTKSDYLVTKMRDSRWVVSDKAAGQAIAILTFDQRERLWRVQKNWTPGSDSAMAFAQALYNLAEQMLREDPSTRPQSCSLSTPASLYIGPYAWVRDPGQPDLDVREIDLKCPKGTIQIYINRTTDVTRGGPLRPIIERVLLYELVNSPSS